MQRVVTAIVLLPAFWATIKLAPPHLFSAVALIVIGLACWECLRMLERRGGRPFKTLGVVAALAITWSFLGLPPRFGADLPLAALTMGVLLLAMGRRTEPRAMLETATSTLFPVLFVGLGLAHLARLRVLPGEDGEDLLMLLLVCVVLGDIAAYYVGRAWGRRPLAPLLSPKKTWEGALAGLVASVLGALLAQAWFYRRLGPGHALALGVALGAAAVLGDLAESLVKRAAGVKDSSNLVPGHGGVLDRTDSLVFSAPLLFFYYRAFLEVDA
jgi:phosphatidate cytidylyltransferase